MKRLLKTIPLVLIALVLFACSQNPVGIFQSIEREREILDERDIPNDIVVGSIAGASAWYFAAAGSLWCREAEDDDIVNGQLNEWTNLLSGHATLSEYQTESLVRFDPDGVGGEDAHVFVILASRRNEEVTAGLYEIDPTTTPPTLPTVPADPVFATDATIYELDRVMVVSGAADDYLVVSVQKTAAAGEARPYALYYSADGVTFSEVTGFEVGQPIIDSASDGTTMAFLTATKLYTDTDLTDGIDPDTADDDTPAFGPVETIIDGRTHRFTGVHYFDSGAGDDWWLADDYGYLYSADTNPASWTTSASQYPISTNNEDPIPFTDFLDVGNMVATELLVGTDGYGYRILGTTAATAPLSPIEEDSNYEASDLAGASILTWYVEDTSRPAYPVPTGAEPTGYTSYDGFLFLAGTAGNGIWRALSYDGPIQWVQE